MPHLWKEWLGHLQCKVSNCIYALRPWSFSTSFTPVALGAVLAYKTSGHFDTIVLLLNIASVLCVHGAGNLINTYYDYKHGIDGKGRSDDRTLVDRRLTPDGVVRLASTLYLIAIIAFMIVSLFFSRAKVQFLAPIFFCGFSGSFLYTGGGLKYIALGDVLVLIIFGPLSVLYSYMSQAGHCNLITLIYAIPIALSAEAILHSNNTRDMESDRRAGAITIAILIGPTCSHILFALLLFLPHVMLIMIGIQSTPYFLLPSIVLPVAFNIEKEFRRGQLQCIPGKTAKHNLLFGLLYVAACCFADARDLPWIRY